MQRHLASQTSRHPLWLLAGFWFCFVIAIAVVPRRLVELIRPSHGSPPRLASLNASFWSHAALTIMHIVPAAIFVLLSVAVLLRRTDGEWLEQIFFPFGAVAGATAYAMSSWAAGGWVSRGYPTRCRNHSSRDGSIARYEFPYTSEPRPVLRHRVLIGFFINASVIEFRLYSKRRRTSNNRRLCFS